MGYLANAVRELAALPGVHVAATSWVYETAPVGPVPQGPYLNACLQVHTHLSAVPLLNAGLRIEAHNGRERIHRFGPRTLDIDLIHHSGASSINTTELVLPHPRAHLRAFVLVPLADIAPHLLLHSRSVADWLHDCPQSDVDAVERTAHRL